MKVPITKTFFGSEEEQAIVQPLRDGWVVQGKYVQEFENKFSDYTDIPHSIATTSCTTALHIAVTSLDLKPGDEVIVPAFTWISTANVVEYLGATPVFCDIDLTTFNIDVKKIEALINERTVGIIPVHLFGLAADMNPIIDLAKQHDLWVVEDAACGFGAYYHGQHVGAFGEMGCFSFHPRKSITTGEGGMITTRDSDLDRLCRVLRDHGASRTDFDRHGNKGSFLLAEYNHLGYNFRMTDLQGAVGVVQIDRGEWIMQQRQRLATVYDDILSNVAGINAPVVPEGYQHGYQAYVTLFAPEKPDLSNVEKLNEQRNTIMMTLEERGISTRQGTHSVALQNYYAKKYNIKHEDFPQAYLAQQLSLTLPLYPQMTDEEQSYVCDNLLEMLNA